MNSLIKANNHLVSNIQDLYRNDVKSDLLLFLEIEERYLFISKYKIIDNKNNTNERITINRFKLPRGVPEKYINNLSNDCEMRIIKFYKNGS